MSARAAERTFIVLSEPYNVKLVSKLRESNSALTNAACRQICLKPYPPTLPQSDAVQPELFGHGFAVGDVPIEFGPELLAVIVDSGVDKFMEDDVVGEFLGQQNEPDVEADVIFRGAASPPCLLLPDAAVVVGEAAFCSDIR